MYCRFPPSWPMWANLFSSLSAFAESKRVGVLVFHRGQLRLNESNLPNFLSHIVEEECLRGQFVEMARIN